MSVHVYFGDEDYDKSTESGKYFLVFLHRASTIPSILDWAIMPGFHVRFTKKKHLREDTPWFVENQLTLILMTQIPFMVDSNTSTWPSYKPFFWGLNEPSRMAWYDGANGDDSFMRNHLVLPANQTQTVPGSWKTSYFLVWGLSILCQLAWEYLFFP